MAQNINARSATLHALVRWETSREFCDDIQHEFSARLGPEDRALFTEMFYGILRNRSLLDFWIDRFRSDGLDGKTRNTLRVGVYQIMRMRIPDHAAVNETVNLGGHSRSLVNAVLRRVIGARDELHAAEKQAPLHIRHSHPEFLIERWTRQFGDSGAEALCAWNNQPAPVTVRANTLKVTAGELLRTVPEAVPSPSHPLAIHTPRLPFSWIVGGLCYVQDPSTLAACDLLQPVEGNRVLDACAAPGGKTTYLAQIMDNKGHIVACDFEQERLKTLKQNIGRLSVRNTEVHRVNWMQKQPFPEESFDCILLDAPCSNTGVMRRRIDVRWRLRPEDFPKMQQRQRELIEKLMPLLKPGGTFVYSTCSLEPEENESVVEWMRGTFPELSFEKVVRILPHRDGTDGAFAARFVNQAGAKARRREKLRDRKEPVRDWKKRGRKTGNRK